MPNNRRAGILHLQINGTVYDLAGDWNHNIGEVKREALIGPNGVQGYKEENQVPFIEGDIRDSRDLDLRELASAKDVTCTLEEANGKTFMLRDAWQAGEATVGSGEGNIGVRFEGMSADEIKP